MASYLSRKLYPFLRVLGGTADFSSSNPSNPTEEPGCPIELPYPLREVQYYPYGSASDFGFSFKWPETETETFTFDTENIENNEVKPQSSNVLKELTGLVSLALSISMLPAYVFRPGLSTKLVAALSKIELKDYVLFSLAILPVLQQYIIEKRKVKDKADEAKNKADEEADEANYRQVMRALSLSERRRTRILMELFMKVHGINFPEAEEDEFIHFLRMAVKGMEEKGIKEKHEAMYKLAKTVLEAKDGRDQEKAPLGAKDKEHGKALEDQSEKAPLGAKDKEHGKALEDQSEKAPLGAKDKEHGKALEDQSEKAPLGAKDKEHGKALEDQSEKAPLGAKDKEHGKALEDQSCFTLSGLSGIFGCWDTALQKLIILCCLYLGESSSWGKGQRAW
ncbi:uncharacterized protein LOC132302799 isoform X3 [Cornus florida]|uniref:uncharacterized protein LOC132302799 isoform X3 n=1 Tax=Cornus florida TaxID=4283 RepID=UPI00289AD5AE|nr:uncharacterized protein LOC132302799 isoform X3 [Cornus florida]XP_059655731.1 uncharacterized protein LOC132302799 isoform X3 [Cornus florida]